MSRLTFVWAVLIVLALGSMAGCAGLMGSERRETNAEVLVLSLGSTNGELAPCG